MSSAGARIAGWLVLLLGCSGAVNSHPATAEPAPAPAAAEASPPEGPSPEPPAAASGPLAPLGVLRPIDGPVRAYVRASGDVLSWLEVGTPAIVVYDTTATAPVRRIPIGSYLDSASYTDLFVDGGVAYVRHGVFHWLDLSAGRERFAATLLTSPPLREVDLAHVSTAMAGDATTIFLALEVLTAAAPTAELVALDRTTGAVRYRRRLGEPARELVAHGGMLVARLGSGALLGLDPATGAERWPLSPPSGADPLTALVPAGATVLDVRASGHVRVIDPATGAVSRAIALGDETTAPIALTNRTYPVAVEGGVLYLPTATATEIGLTAIALDTGAILWRSPRLPYVLERHGLVDPLLVDRDSVIGCFGDGTLRVFDRGTGSLTQALGLGHCELAPLPADADGSRRIAAMYRNAWHLLGRGGAVPASEHARIEGTVTVRGAAASRVRVVVHDREVTTDVAGRFAVEIDASELATVSTAAGEGMTGNVALVRLDGSGRYRAGLTIVPAPPIDF